MVEKNNQVEATSVFSRMKKGIHRGFTEIVKFATSEKIKKKTQVIGGIAVTAIIAWREKQRSEMKEENKALVSRSNSLREENESLKKKNMELKSNNEQLEKDIDNLSPSALKSGNKLAGTKMRAMQKKS